MSTPEGTKKRDYSRYDQMSTAELEQLLRLDFQASENGDSDLDAILYLSDLLARRNGPSDPDAAWAQFQTKYRPYADGRSLYDFGDEEGSLAQAPPASRPRSVRRLRRLSILAAVLTACLLGGMVAQAAGVDVWGAIARWTDETFRLIPADSGGDTGAGKAEEDMEQLRSSLQAWGLADRFPTWHPDGFVPGELEITELNSSVSAHVTFFGEDRTYSVVIQHFIQYTDNTGTFEKDDTPVEEYVHNGQTFYILSNIDTLTATTYDGEFMVMISGVLTREETKAIIDSIDGLTSTQKREQIQASLAEEGQRLYCPKIPEGFVRSDSNYYGDPFSHQIDWSELYLRGDQSLVFGLTMNKGPSYRVYEKDDTPVEEYVYHGITHYIFSNNGTTTAAWLVENAEYYMWVTDGAVDMKALIRSAYEAE